MPTLDNGDWLKERVTFEADRMSLVAIAEALEIALGDPEVPDWLKNHMRVTGQVIAFNLMAQGLIVPEDRLSRL